MVSYAGNQEAGWMSRCTGHCCKAFEVPLSLILTQSNIQDGHQIRDMIIPLEETRDGFWLCGCWYFDGKDCTIYETRPRMCRNYPYGRPCNFDGCTFSES